MRSSILAMIVAFGTAIAVPATAQQGAAPGQQMQDKGIMTGNSGASGYVRDQEAQDKVPPQASPSASGYTPGQPRSNGNQTTTGSSAPTSSGRGSEVPQNPR